MKKIDKKELVISKVYIVCYGYKLPYLGPNSYDVHMVEFSKRAEAVNFIKENLFKIAYFQINSQDVVRINGKIFKTDVKGGKMQYIDDGYGLEDFNKLKEKIR